jgi:hypothetical protein
MIYMNLINMRLIISFPPCYVIIIHGMQLVICDPLVIDDASGIMALMRPARNGKRRKAGQNGHAIMRSIYNAENYNRF